MWTLQKSKAVIKLPLRTQAQGMAFDRRPSSYGSPPADLLGLRHQNADAEALVRRRRVGLIAREFVGPNQRIGIQHQSQVFRRPADEPPDLIHCRVSVSGTDGKAGHGSTQRYFEIRLYLARGGDDF